jgi:squalene-hopene/tetraprenyl-beta-curcumene cyclase
MTPGLHVADALLAAASRSALRGSARILGLQREDGFWCGDLTTGVPLESDWLLLLLWLYPPQDGVWTPPARERVDRAARSILERQLPDGGYGIYPSGPSDVSASVQAYFALKLAGLPVDGDALTKLRERILALGGIQATDSYVKIGLSLFNLYPRDCVPTVPPEVVLLGNLPYRMSAWTRAILLPLSIVQALVPEGRPAPVGFTLEELFCPGVPSGFHREGGLLSWNSQFLRLDAFSKWWERHGLRSVRQEAIHQAGQWVLQRLEHAGGFGAAQLPLMYSIMALDLLGYGPEAPARSRAQSQFDRLLIEEPVRDTALATLALSEAGNAPAEPLERATRSLLAQEVRRRGDWSVNRPKAEPSGWSAAFGNEFYPGIDSTALGRRLAARHAIEGRRLGCL